MSSCTKQKRAALVEWRGLTQSSHSTQGSSYGHYSQGPATQAIETLQASTPQATQSAAARSAAALPTGGTCSFGPALSPASLRRGLHPSDLLPLLRPVARGGIDHGQPHRPELAAHARRLGTGIPFQLPPRLLETTLVAVASGAYLGRTDCQAPRRYGRDSSGGRRYGGRASRQEGVRQGPASRRRAFVALLHGLPLRAQVGRAGHLGAVAVYDQALGVADFGGVVSQSRQRQKPPGPSQTPGPVDAANAQGHAALVSRPPLYLCRRWRLRHPRVGQHGGLP